MQPMTQLSNSLAHDLQNAGIVQSISLTQRFLTSLLTKRFVILTGLSGSGKTRLAQSFAIWLDGIQPTVFTKELFEVGDRIAADRISYDVDALDTLSVQFSTVRDDGRAIKVTLPIALIEEWVQAINSNGFTRDTRTRTIRDAVAVSTLYSTQLNSFESPLKAAAFHILERGVLSSQNQSLPTSVYHTASHYSVVAVGADWHNSEPILGYPDALNPKRYVRTPILDLMLKAKESPASPHFLILDEMNLSHVERYFADVLSAIESGEPLHLYDSLNGTHMRDGVPPSLVLPPNLFVIGTVNVDETTYLFSPKVLDRANSIEFRVQQSEIDRFLDETAPVDLAALAGKGHQFASAFLRSSQDTPPSLNAESAGIANTEMKAIFRVLAEHGLEFGYRTAYEMDRFIRQYARLVPDWNIYDALDAQVYQKTLPRLNGSRATLEPVLSALADFCQRPRPDSLDPHYPLSLHKIARMRRMLRQNGFTSFAEA